MFSLLCEKVHPFPRTANNLVASCWTFETHFASLYQWGVSHILALFIFTFRNKMDVIKAVQHYAEKMINDVPGMKALLLDTETVSIPSLSLAPYKALFTQYPSDTHYISSDNTINTTDQRMLFD